MCIRDRLFSVAYTRSKLVDDASSVFDASILTGPLAMYPVADSFNRTLERDYSTGDIPHVFVSSVVWDVPFGAGRAHQLEGWLGAIANDWTVTGLVTLQSGVPIAVTQTTNFNAFAGAPQFTIGSASRNPVRGPGYKDVDLALMRRLGLGASHSLELRAEVFN